LRVVCYREPLLQASLVLNSVDSQDRFCFKARPDLLNTTTQETPRDVRQAERPWMLYNSRRSMPFALGIIQLMFRECLRATPRVRGMSALNYRPVHLPKHPIGSRSNILRASRKGERVTAQNFWTALWSWGRSSNIIHTPSK
jgi:hypothetical protein